MKGKSDIFCELIVHLGSNIAHRRCHLNTNIAMPIFLIIATFYNSVALMFSDYFVRAIRKQ